MSNHSSLLRRSAGPGSPGWRRRALLLLLLLTIPLGCGGNPETGRPPRALVLIIIDTLRADRLGFMGYDRVRTPNLDRLASRGVRFTQAMTPVPVTLPAIASLLTGRLPFRHGVRDNDRYALSDEEVTLTERLRDAGWRTGAVVGSAIIGSDRGLSQGFEVYDDDFEGPYPVYSPSLRMFAEEMAETRRRADVVTDRAIALLDEFHDDPFFLLVHYFDVHSYYDPPPEYAGSYPGGRYDGEISFVDAEIGRLLVRLEQRSDVLLVVVSDHGEGLGDHGEPEHGFLLYQSTLWVPVVVAGPGVPAGSIREDPISLVDLEPTLASILGLPGAPSPRDGRVLRWAYPETEETSLYAETFRTAVSYHWSELRGLRRGKWKVINGPPVELYDLQRDPGETEDLGEEDPAPALLEELRTLTGGETREDVLARLQGSPDPERKELLESLGYVGGSEPSLAGSSYPHPGEELPRWIGRQEKKVLYRKGVTLAAQGQYREAIAVLDSVLVLEPDRVDALYNRAICRQKLGDLAGFESDLSRAFHLEPEYLPGLKARAQFAEQRGRTEESFRLWQRIHELDDSDPEALQAVAQHYLKQDDPGSALPYLRALVNELPRDSVARFNLGLAAWKTGRHEEARSHLERFLELAPQDPRAPQIRQMLATQGG